MRERQVDRIQQALKSGKWTGCEVFRDKLHIGDYRKRLCELNEKYPGRYVSRSRTRKNPDGSPKYRMNDWRDTFKDATLRADILTDISEARVGHKPLMRYGMYISEDAVLRESVEMLTEMLFEAATDSYGEE